MDTILLIKLAMVLGYGIACWANIRKVRDGFGINSVLILLCAGTTYGLLPLAKALEVGFTLLLPISVVNLVGYGLIGTATKRRPHPHYRAVLPVHGPPLVLENIKRGISVIASAGGGKTESVVYQLLRHFAKHGFCGVIHDYKNFELAEMAVPLFAGTGIRFFIVSFDRIHHRVNPIAPAYMQDEEGVNEVARVLVENLMEFRESGSQGASKFFYDAAQGLVAGLIWRLCKYYPGQCTLPHLIAIYQELDTEELIDFLKADLISRAMADAFISGKGSPRQMAAVKSTLANAFNKITTRKIFMALSADEVPLDINATAHESAGIICVVNNPFYETSFSPVIAMLVHTIVKQMSRRNARPSFLMMEEAPTLRLLNMHRIPATLRSYDIATVYVMQDKIQNDIMYGDKMGKAILSNLSYQFFGKVNDPDTAKYYERFFEIVKRKTRSVHKSGGLSFDSKVTIGEKEVAKTRADAFYGLGAGEFIVLGDGRDRKVRFREPEIEKRSEPPKKVYTIEELDANFERIFAEIRHLFQQEREKVKKEVEATVNGPEASPAPSPPPADRNGPAS